MYLPKGLLRLSNLKACKIAHMPISGSHLRLVCFGYENFKVFEELFAEDFVDHITQPNMTPDKAGVRKLYGYMRDAFPDFHAVIHWQLADVGGYSRRRGAVAGTSTECGALIKWRLPGPQLLAQTVNLPVNCTSAPGGKRCSFFVSDRHPL